MYASGPSEDQAKELEAAGFSLDDVVAEDVEIWPDNVRAYELFNALATQWRAGMGGPTGLDYSAVEVTMRLCGLPPAEWPELFADLRVMERAALEAMSSKE